MNNARSNNQLGRATTIRKTFSRETSVSTEIQADPGIVWALLTHAPDFPRWNSTVVSIKGDIRPGGDIQLKSTLDEKRIFKLKIKEFQPEQRLVWGDSMGQRVYTITLKNTGVIFTMTEKIGGIFFPFFAKYIPPFDESFERFAVDLKKESESIQRSKN
jgi:uncharacterized protein YndB with AHSA1/START domain